MIKNICNSEHPFLRFFMKNNSNIPGLPDNTILLRDFSTLEYYDRIGTTLLFALYTDKIFPGNKSFHQDYPLPKGFVDVVKLTRHKGAHVLSISESQADNAFEVFRGTVGELNIWLKSSDEHGVYAMLNPDDKDHRPSETQWLRVASDLRKSINSLAALSYRPRK